MSLHLRSLTIFLFLSFSSFSFFTQMSVLTRAGGYYDENGVYFDAYGGWYDENGVYYDSFGGYYGEDGMSSLCTFWLSSCLELVCASTRFAFVPAFLPVYLPACIAVDVDLCIFLSVSLSVKRKL